MVHRCSCVYDCNGSVLIGLYQWILTIRLGELWWARTRLACMWTYQQNSSDWLQQTVAWLQQPCEATVSHVTFDVLTTRVQLSTRLRARPVNILSEKGNAYQLCWYHSWFSIIIWSLISTCFQNMNVCVSDNASAQLILLVVTVLAGWVLNGSEHNVLCLLW